MEDVGDSASAYAAPRNLNVMDEQGMPSDAAQAARVKAQKVMAALDSGAPGAADEAMGKRHAKGNVGVIPFDWLKSKFGGKKEKKTSETVIR